MSGQVFIRAGLVVGMALLLAFLPGRIATTAAQGGDPLALPMIKGSLATQGLTPIRVVYSTVNVRNGPGTSSYIKIGEVYQGQVFVPAEKRADSTYGAWYRIPFPATSSGSAWGWVAQKDAYGTILVVEDSSYAASVRTIINDDGIGWRWRQSASSSSPYLQDSAGNSLKTWNGQQWIVTTYTTGPDTCYWHAFYVPRPLNAYNWQSTMWLRDDAIRATATIEGYVRNPSGQPVSGVDLDAYLPDYSSIRTVTTDANGFYRIPGVPACGRVNLYVFHPNYLEQTVYVYSLSPGETRRQDITIQPALPDLVVTYLSGPSTGQIGGQIAVQATVRNQGYSAAGPFRLGFYFSTDSAITTGDVFSGSFCSFSGLNAGSSANCSVNIGVPSSLAPGTYYLGAIVDDLNQVSEGNEGNNARAADTGPITLYRSNQPPVARFVMCYSGTICKEEGQTLDVTLSSGSTARISFSAANSSDPDGDALTYRWQINGVQVSTARDFAYDLGVGTHSVVLTVTDSRGASSQASGTVVIRAPSCSYSIAPTSANFGPQGGNGSVNVSAPAGCAWTASSNVPWITITSGSSGSGNGTVMYAVAPNSSTSARTGTMTIAGQTFTVYQSGSSPATYSISGRVVDPSGNPIPGVTISDHTGRTTTTGSDGRYILSGLAAGTYTITPAKSGYIFSPASRTVTVPPDGIGVDFVGTISLKPWTFLLYLDGDNDLYPYLRIAIFNLEAQPSNPNVNILVLFDGNSNNDSWRFLVQPGGKYTIGVNKWHMGELNMGNPDTLRDFILWARENFPAQHYYLAIANHGRGTEGIAWDVTNNNDYLSPTELRTALQQATNSGQWKIDVLHYDACLMAMLENAYQVKDYADYLVASQNLGWSVFAYEAYARYAQVQGAQAQALAAPYEFASVASKVTASTTPRQLAMDVADAYFNHPLIQPYPRTISVLDLSRAEAVRQAVDNFSTALRNNLNAVKIYVQNARSATQKFDSRDYYKITDDDEYLDLYHFAQRVNQYVPNSEVQAAAQRVMDVLNSGFVVVEHHQSGMWKNREYWDLDNAHGVSIYFPPRSGSWDYSMYISHQLFRFTAEGGWDEFLVDYFGVMGLPPEQPTEPGLPPMLAPEYKVYLPLVLKSR